MPIPTEEQTRLQIRHVLFIDIVGYSKLLLNQQSELQRELNEVVSGTSQFRESERQQKLIRLPTGDGMALVFRDSPEAPVQCALEIAQALKAHPRIALRMGIHSGPVNEVADVNQRQNIAGAGINMARRVMDCGDAGHILVSKHVAEDLEQHDRWRPLLHEIGTCQVKHGAKIDIANLYSDEVGNRQLPKKFQALKKHRSRVRWAEVALGLLVVAAVVAAFLFVLRRPMHPPLSAPEKSIAVLPFENLSEKKENAFFADGVQDEILTDLAKVADLKVISRTSVSGYRDTAGRNPRKIGQELGVAHLLEGSVQRVGNRVRVNAQLIDARSDAHLWAQTYDRDLADVFAIQSEIAQAIADQLQAKMSPGEKASISQAPTTDLTANALYVEARQLEFKPPEDQSLFKAVRLLDQAVARDPHFVLAYCALSRDHLILFFGGYDHTPARRELANRAAQNALRLAPDSGEVHLALARYAYWGFRDYDRARAELDLARRTLPNDANLFFLSGAIDRRQGRWVEATRNFERAVELDPRNMDFLMNAGETYQSLHRYSDSSRLYERALAISPHDYFARILHALQPFLEHADVQPLRRELNAILTEEPSAADKIADVLFQCAILERDPAATARAVAAIPKDGISPGGNFVHPREWFVGVAARTFQDTPTAQASFTAARAIEEKVVLEQPDYAPAWSLLGQIDGAFGHAEDAVREGRRACELLPVAKDAVTAAQLITNLAVIYAWTGEKERAVEQLAISAQTPAGVAYGELKLYPRWDALRGDPRFDKIVASLAPKEAK